MGEEGTKKRCPACAGGDMETLRRCLEELAVCVRRCAGVFCTEDASEDETVLTAVAVPGKGIQVMDVEECFGAMRWFGVDDMEEDSPVPGLRMAYDNRQMLDLGGSRYLAGSAVLYRRDEKGEDVSVTAMDIYKARRMAEERTVELCADGKEFPALRLD